MKHLLLISIIVIPATEIFGQTVDLKTINEIKNQKRAAKVFKILGAVGIVTSSVMMVQYNKMTKENIKPMTYVWPTVGILSIGIALDRNANSKMRRIRINQ